MTGLPVLVLRMIVKFKHVLCAVNAKEDDISFAFNGLEEK